jgi:hypothetical protein
MLRKNTIVTGRNRQVMLRAPMAVFDDQIDVLDKVDLVVSYDEQPGPGEPAKGDHRTTKILLKDVTVNSVQKKGEDIVAIGVVLLLEDTEKVIWALNYGKEVRVLKSSSAKARQEEQAADPGSAGPPGPADEQALPPQGQPAQPEAEGQPAVEAQSEAQPEAEAQPQAEPEAAEQQEQAEAPATDEEGVDGDGGS